MTMAKFLKVSGLILVVGYSLLVITGYKRFVVWPQITDYYYDAAIEKSPQWFCETILEQQFRLNSKKLVKVENINLKEIADTCQSESSIAKNPYPSGESLEGSLSTITHKIRVTIFYPLVKAGLIFNLNLHFLFSIVCLLSLVIMAALLSRLFVGSTNSAYYIYLVFFCLLSLFMNGRMIISYLSISILIWTMCSRDFSFQTNKNIFLYLGSIFTALTLSTVSSGISFVVLALFIYDVVVSSKFFRLPLYGRIGIILITGAQCFWVTMGVAKNILYYGGNMEAPIKMMNHGVGTLLHSPLRLILVAMGLIFISLAIYKYRQYLNNILWVGFLFFMAGGIFGFSVLSGALVFLMTIFMGQCIIPRIQQHSTFAE